jgi:nitric oxide reductase activation protein
MARANNLDGYAMEHCVKKLVSDYPDFPRRVLFVISDGQPHASGYGKEPSFQHMRNVCEFGRRNKVGVYGIGIANAYTKERGFEMYGPGNCVILKDVMSSLQILTSFLRQIAVRPV